MDTKEIDFLQERKEHIDNIRQIIKDLEENSDKIDAIVITMSKKEKKGATTTYRASYGPAAYCLGLAEGLIANLKKDYLDVLDEHVDEW